jgi:hypothetical protein
VPIWSQPPTGQLPGERRSVAKSSANREDVRLKDGPNLFFSQRNSKGKTTWNDGEADGG